MRKRPTENVRGDRLDSREEGEKRIGTLVGVARTSLGDAAAFRVFYDEALPQVYSYLFHRCGGDAASAEELTQETFIAAVMELQKGELVTDPIAWVFGIARHKLVDHYRRQERRERLAARVPAIDLEAREWVGVEQRELTLCTLAALPAAQRAALVLRYLDDLSVGDVARELGKSVHATESILARGKESFRRIHAEFARD